MMAVLVVPMSMLCASAFADEAPEPGVELPVRDERPRPSSPSFSNPTEAGRSYTT